MAFDTRDFSRQPLIMPIANFSFFIEPLFLFNLPWSFAQAA
jgi:hypothetical protein